MKRILLIILLLVFCFSLSVDANAKLKFGDWSRWDEQFPPYKTWVRHRNDGFGFFREVLFEDDKQRMCWVLNLFYKNKKDLMSIMLFSYERPEEQLEADYKFALAAFPPEKGKMMIRAYKTEEDQILKFVEEWEVAFEDIDIIVTTITTKVDTTEVDTIVEGEFAKSFKEWAISSRQVDVDFDVRLVVFDKGFVILISPELENKDLLNKIEQNL